MSLPAGTECYTADVAPVTARGASYTEDELDSALESSVAEIVFDDAGTRNLESLLASIPATDFSDAALKRVLSSRPKPENWRVGEALAEVFLVEYRSCSFPWPSGRDLKNPAASPSGTDLVGFQAIAGSSDAHRFAFGEVKTSEEEKWPPSVMDGRHGLRKQLERLRDSPSVKDALVKYLGHHAPGTGWLPCYLSAARRYLANPADVSLFGLLIRDVEPKPDDLASRAQSLANLCPEDTGVDLRAMYLPSKVIGTLAAKAEKMRERNHGRT